MPEYLHPGVYIEEIERGPRPIEGVPTSTAAFLGEAERGPTMPRPRDELQGLSALVRRRVRPGQVPALCDQRLLRKRREADLHCRIASLSAKTASADFGSLFSLQAAGAGSWGNRVYARIDPSTTMSAQRDPQPIGFRDSAGLLVQRS